MSPTAPTFTLLTEQLTKAYRRIRELEARQAELLAAALSTSAAGVDRSGLDGHQLGQPADGEGRHQ